MPFVGIPRGTQYANNIAKPRFPGQSWYNGFMIGPPEQVNPYAPYQLDQNPPPNSGPVTSPQQYIGFNALPNDEVYGGFGAPQAAYGVNNPSAVPTGGVQSARGIPVLTDPGRAFRGLNQQFSSDWSPLDAYGNPTSLDPYFNVSPPGDPAAVQDIAARDKVWGPMAPPTGQVGAPLPYGYRTPEDILKDYPDLNMTPEQYRNLYNQGVNPAQIENTQNPGVTPPDRIPMSENTSPMGVTIPPGTGNVLSGATDAGSFQPYQVASSGSTFPGPPTVVGRQGYNATNPYLSIPPDVFGDQGVSYGNYTPPQAINPSDYTGSWNPAWPNNPPTRDFNIATDPVPTLTTNTPLPRQRPPQPWDPGRVVAPTRDFSIATDPVSQIVSSPPSGMPQSSVFNVLPWQKDPDNTFGPVRQLQTRLAQAGLYHGAIDGIAGPLTQAATARTNNVFRPQVFGPAAQAGLAARLGQLGSPNYDPNQFGPYLQGLNQLGQQGISAPAPVPTPVVVNPAAAAATMATPVPGWTPPPPDLSNISDTQGKTRGVVTAPPPPSPDDPNSFARDVTQAFMNPWSTIGNIYNKLPTLRQSLDYLTNNVLTSPAGGSETLGPAGGGVRALNRGVTFTPGPDIGVIGGGQAGPGTAVGANGNVLSYTDPMGINRFGPNLLSLGSSGFGGGGGGGVSGFGSDSTTFSGNAGVGGGEGHSYSPPGGGFTSVYSGMPGGLAVSGGGDSGFGGGGGSAFSGGGGGYSPSETTYGSSDVGGSMTPGSYGGGTMSGV